MRCVSLADDGAMCGAGDECRSTHCVDGVCCAEACDGLCAACDLPHQAGRCVAIPASTDPARECPGSAVCDGHGACVTPAMPDAGVRRDAAMSADAATTPAPARTGCGCVVPGRSSHRGTGLFALAMLGVLALRRRRLRRGAALAVIALVLGVPSVVLATTLSGSLGFRWDIDDNVGRPGAILDGTSDAYDGCYSLAVGGTSYAVPSGSASTLSAGGRQVDLPPMSVGSGLVAERHIYVPTTATWARLIEVVANPTASAVTTTITISGNLGSDSSTRLMATSSGDLVLDTSDTWFATDDVDGSGDPSLAHVFRGVGGAVGVTSVTLVTDQITYVYGVTIPAHGRVAILHFAVQASTQALAQAAALQVSMLGPETHASADSWASSIVNWAIGMDTCASASDGSSCTSWGSATGICHGHTCCSGCWDGASCLPGYDVAACGVVGGACRACADGNTCTDDVCRSGVCSNPSASASLACDDGRYCTAHDHCNGSGGCTPGTTSPCDDHVSCTIDSCDETTDACTNVFSMGCTIGGECVGVGEHHVAYPCLVCDPTRNATDWSMEASGAVCGSARCSGGHVFTAGTCDAAGTCSAPRPTACASMTCAPDRMSCEDVCTSTSCPPGTRCGAALHCIPVLGLGSNCTMNEECVTSRCADGLCCDRACDGTCEACDLPGREGTCRAIPTGTDPAAECGALHVCDGHGACVSRVATDAAHSPDAGGIEAGPVDAGAVPPRAAGSCGCAVPGPSESRAAVTGLLVGLALLVLRRRRAW